MGGSGFICSRLTVTMSPGWSVNRVLETNLFENHVRGSGEIELNQFKSHKTAQRYVATIARLIPGAVIQLKREQGPLYTVTLDQDQLSPVDQFRLSRLFPAIDKNSAVD